MKKLMKTMASAAVALLGFGAFADLPSQSATFEGLSTGEKTVSALVTYDDTGSSGGDKYWFAVTNDSQALDTVIGVVTNETGRGNYFAMETSAPLYRTINSTTSQYGSAFDDAAEAETIGSDGIYLDTMVKFTPAEDAFKEGDLDEGDKIAISYVGESDSGITNKIVVRAGYVDGSTITPTNYIMNLPAEVVATNWCHLIVRTIANVGSANAPVGFAIYLTNENDNDSPNPLTYDTGVEAGDSAYINSLSGVAKAYLYTESVHALLPSLINSGDNKTKLTAVGFKGNGCIDDVVFKSGSPVIEDITVKVAWDAGVETYTIVDNNNNTITNAAATGGSAGFAEFTLDPETVYLTVTATYYDDDEHGHYEAGTWTDGTGAEISGSTFTVADGATLNINSMLPKFDVGGDHYGTFAEALDAAVEAGTAAEPATIQLLADADSALTFTEGYIILDLNGKTIQGGDLDTYSVVNSGATLTIIDSATGGTVAAPTCADAEGAFYTDNGSTTINGGIFASTVYTEKMQDSEAAGDIVVTAGSFYDPDYDPEDDESAFYLKDYLGDGVGEPVFNDETLYFTVGGQIIGTYTVTVAPTANATYAAAYKSDDSAITPDNDVLTVTVGQTIVITATPAANYEYATTPDGWTAGQDGEITIEVSAAGTVAIPAPTEKMLGTYTVTVTPTANATYAAAYVSDDSAITPDNDVLTVTVGQTIVITATPAANYEYATTPDGWTAGQDGEITIEVSEAGTVAIPAPTAESSYPSYIPEDAAVKAKYDTWATTYGADTGSAYEDAFLLNIAPDAVDQTLEPASITISGSTITIAANKDLKGVNGKVYIKTAGTLAGLESASWGEATLNATTGAIEMTSNGTAAFFKIKVDF